MDISKNYKFVNKIATTKYADKINTIYDFDCNKLFGVPYKYLITSNDDILACIEFKKDTGIGITEKDLLEILKDRLSKKQDSPLKCKLNQQALMHINYALEAITEKEKIITKEGKNNNNE